MPNNDEEDFSGMPDYDEGRCPAHDFDMDEHMALDHRDSDDLVFDEESEWDDNEDADNMADND